MPHGEELFPSRDDAASRPAFMVALRGYDKRQVDDYLARRDGELSTLVTERDRALSQVQHLATRLDQVQAELVEARQRPARVDRASFRDLGPTVDEILALAEKQAKDIVDLSAQRAANHQAEAERVLAEARLRSDQLRADSEALHERAEHEAKRINEQSIQQLEDARAEAEELVDAARQQAQQEIEAARTQTQQEIQARNEALAQMQAELEGAQQQLTQARQESAAAEREVAELQQRFDDISQQLASELTRLDNARRAADSAERHAKEVRARVQREAERVAQLAAAAVMAAAARGAETGEYPMVVPVQSGGNGLAGDTTEQPAIGADPRLQEAANGDGPAGYDADDGFPPPREAEPVEARPDTD